MNNINRYIKGSFPKFIFNSNDKEYLKENKFNKKLSNNILKQMEENYLGEIK